MNILLVPRMRMTAREMLWPYRRIHNLISVRSSSSLYYYEIVPTRFYHRFVHGELNLTLKFRTIEDKRLKTTKHEVNVYYTTSISKFVNLPP